MSTCLALNRTVRLAVLMAAVLATSCGGGGGDSNPQIEASPLLVQITAQNQDAVARATAGTFFSLSGVAALPTAAPPPAKAQAAGVNALTMHALSKATGPRQGASEGARRLSVVSQTEACTVSGTMTMTIDDRDNNAAVSAGDVLTLSFSQCKEDASTLMDGALVVGIGSISEMPGSMRIGGTFAYQQLIVIDDGYTSSLNGVTSATYTEDTAPEGSTVRLEASVASGGLVAQSSTPKSSDTFTYGAGFASLTNEFVPSSSTATGWSTTALNGTVHVASLGGRITLVTDATTAVHQSFDANFPDSGQVSVLGNASQLRLTVINSDRVRMELDGNNDATYEGTKEMTWGQLLP
jgi:hypothetical protein